MGRPLPWGIFRSKILSLRVKCECPADGRARKVCFYFSGLEWVDTPRCGCDFVAVLMRVLRVFNAGRGLTGFGVEVS